MKDKDLRHLKRVELLDMLIEQGRLVDAQAEEITKLKEECEELKKQLADYYALVINPTEKMTKELKELGIIE